MLEEAPSSVKVSGSSLVGADSPRGHQPREPGDLTPDLGPLLSELEGRETPPNHAPTASCKAVFQPPS